MVVVAESDTVSDIKSAASPGRSLGEPSLPPYSPRVESHSFHSQPSVGTSETRPLIPSPMERGRRTARRRFMAALVVAVLIFVIGLSVSSDTVKIRAKALLRTTEVLTTVPHGPPAGPREEDGTIISCFPQNDFSKRSQQVFEADGPLYERSVSFTLPSSPDLLYFVARGAYSFGSLKFELSDKHSDTIDVDVVLKYKLEEMLEHTQVCSLQRGDDQRGIGFFTPNHERHPRQKDSYVIFNSTIRFPRPDSINDPLVIKRLETNMSVFSHFLGDFESLLSFDAISLKTAIGSIHASGVSTTDGVFETAVGTITGSFNASNNLLLTGNVGGVTANINLKNDGGDSPTRLNITGSMGAVVSNISLISTSQSSQPKMASFSLNVQTTTSPLKLAFPEAPIKPFPRLDLSAKTTIGAADVALHPTYEGTIIQRTSLFGRSRLVENPFAADPSGEGRHRSIVKNVRRSMSEARVWWGNDSDKEHYGNVEVITTLSQNTVVLT